MPYSAAATARPAATPAARDGKGITCASSRLGELSSASAAASTSCSRRRLTSCRAENLLTVLDLKTHNQQDAQDPTRDPKPAHAIYTGRWRSYTADADGGGGDTADADGGGGERKPSTRLYSQPSVPFVALSASISVRQTSRWRNVSPEVTPAFRSLDYADAGCRARPSAHICASGMRSTWYLRSLIEMSGTPGILRSRRLSSLSHVATI
jgi:hypothetical protein